MKGEGLIRDMLFSASTTPSLFSADATQLLRLVRDHGLKIESSREEMKIKLLRHLLSGDCFHAGAGPSARGRKGFLEHFWVFLLCLVM